MKKALTLLMSFVLVLAGGIFLASCDLFKFNSGDSIKDLANNPNANWSITNYIVHTNYTMEDGVSYNVDGHVFIEGKSVKAEADMINSETLESEKLYLRDNQVYFSQLDDKWHLSLVDYFHYYNELFPAVVGIDYESSDVNGEIEYFTLDTNIENLRTAIANSSSDIETTELESGLLTKSFAVTVFNEDQPLMYTLTFKDDVLQSMTINDNFGTISISRTSKELDLTQLYLYQDLNNNNGWKATKIVLNTQLSMSKFKYTVESQEVSAETLVSYVNDQLSLKLDITFKTEQQQATIYLQDNKVYFTESKINYFLSIEDFAQKGEMFLPYLPISLTDMEGSLQNFPYIDISKEIQIREIDYMAMPSFVIIEEPNKITISDETSIIIISNNKLESLVVKYLDESNRVDSHTIYTGEIVMPDFSDYVEYTI